LPLEADHSDIYTLDGIDGQPKRAFSFIATDAWRILALNEFDRLPGDWAISD
jgi:hypothetical protein